MDALDNQAAYWNGPVTRKEFQAVQEDNAALLKYLADTIIGADDVLGLGTVVAAHQLLFQFLMERAGITPEEIAAWQAKKSEELSAQNTAEKPKPQIVN